MLKNGKFSILYHRRILWRCKGKRALSPKHQLHACHKTTCSPLQECFYLYVYSTFLLFLLYIILLYIILLYVLFEYFYFSVLLIETSISIYLSSWLACYTVSVSACNFWTKALPRFKPLYYSLKGLVDSPFHCTFCFYRCIAHEIKFHSCDA